MLPAQLAELLAGAQVTVTPVIDPAESVSVNAYEHPEALKDRVWLRTGGDHFPHAAGVGDRHLVDFDHPDPYQRHGPPGQTGTHNSGPMIRRNHRIKTHAGYTARQTGPGEYLWRTPHGYHRLVDHHGTHPIPAPVGDGLLSHDPLDRALARLLLDHHAGKLAAG